MYRTSRISELHKVLAGGAVVQLVGLALTLLLGVQLARYLGPVGYGLYGVVLGVVSLVSVPAQGGLPMLAVKEASSAVAIGSSTNLRDLFAWFTWRSAAFSILASAMAFIVLVIAFPVALAGRGTLVALGGALIVTLALSSVLASLLRGIGLNLAGQAIDLILKPGLTCAIVLATFLYARRLEVGWAVGAQVAVSALCVAIAAAVFFVGSPASSMRSEAYIPGPWKRVAGAFSLNSFLSALNGNYPILLAGLLAAAADVGILRVALSAWAVVGLPIAVANLAGTPVIARQSAEGDQAAVATSISHITLATSASTLLGFAALALIGRPLLVYLFGPPYAAAYIPLLILSMGSVLISCFGIAGNYLNVTGREGVVVKSFAVSVAAGLISAIPLAIYFGISGIAASTVIMAAAWHGYAFIVRRSEIDAPLSLIEAFRHERARLKAA